MSELIMRNPKYKKISDLITFLENIKSEKGDLNICITDPMLWADSNFTLATVSKGLTEREMQKECMGQITKAMERKIIGYSLPKFLFLKEAQSE